MTITAESERDRYRISLSNREVVYVAAAEWNASWSNIAARAWFAVPPVQFVSRLGVSVAERRGTAPELCAGLLNDLRH